MKKKDKIRHEKNSLNSEKIKITILSFIIGAILLAIKFYAYYLTHSQSIYSDAMESIVNVVAGFVTIVVIWMASKPADSDHPYGHGKVESFAAAFEGGSIFFAGVLILVESIKVLFSKVELAHLDFGLVLVILAGVINGVLGKYLIWRGKKLHSEALISSGTHLMTDMFTSVGVVLGLFIVKFTGWLWADPVVAIIFSFSLIYSGGKIIINSTNNLVDGHDKDTLLKIFDTFQNLYRPGVIHIHHTRAIRSGAHHHVDCHMVVPEFWSVDVAHQFCEDFEIEFIEKYPVSSELHIHLDPCRKKYCQSCEINECDVRVKKFVKRKELTLVELTSPEENDLDYDQ